MPILTTLSELSSWSKELFVAGYCKALVAVFDIELPGNLMIGVASMSDRDKIDIGPFYEADTSDEGGPFAHIRNRNCLVDGSRFTGLLDCEVLPALRILLLELNDLNLAHSIVPACLAAEYPPYLRWDGMREDRCAALTEHGDIDYMNPALFIRFLQRPEKERAAELCTIFLETARSQNPLYAQALEEGKSLRQLIEWVMFVDWDGDFVWQGLDLWVSNVRERIIDARLV
ncbi:hypothetical protein B0H14DRAFT_2554943 [Mycena olivaceomarginata]|nr:hypothetical protein B0H14DRAFT_2554943 [Mycena olivaceomarginata]